MLLLIFVVMTSIIAAFYNYNSIFQQQTQFDRERTQEKILISTETNKELYIISSATISNIGSIEVKIRALYKIENGQTIFVCDPSIDPILDINPNISPTKALTIDLSTYMISSQAKLIAATERGTKTFEYDPSLSEEQETQLKDYDPTKFYVGPLMLKFNEFWYRKTLSDGSFDPLDTWHLGWNITQKLPISIAFNITVTNIGDRNITLNRLSAFNLLLTGTSSSLPWYIQPTNHTTNTQPLVINQTATLTFTWNTPVPNAQTQTLSSTFKDSTSMIFLTFFGVYNELDGKTTPYAQTIPFQATLTTGG